MNVFNRIIMTLLGLVLVVGGVLGLLGALAASVGTQVLTTLGIGHLVTLVSPFSPCLAAALPAALGIASKLLIVGAIGVVLGVIVLVLELRGLRRPRPIALFEDPQGRVTISQDSLRVLVEHEAARVPGVRRASARVQAKGEGLVVHCNLAIWPDYSLPEMAAAVQQQVREAVKDLLGQALARLDIETTVVRPSTPAQQRA